MADEKTPIVQKKASDIKLKVLNDDNDGEDINQLFPHNPFNEVHDKKFWEEVKEIRKGDEDKTLSQSIMECRLNRVKSQADDAGKDEVMLYLFDIYDKFHGIAERRDEMEMLPAFVQQLSEFIDELIKEDNKKGKKKSVYSRPLEISDEVDMTVLHLAAARNLTSVIDIVLTYHPKQCYRSSFCGGPKQQVALEVALEKFHDDAASLLITHMENKASIRQLFHYDDEDKENLFDFNNLVKRGDMQKTVKKVLDSLIDSEFPFHPKKPDDSKLQDEWQLPNVKPQRYHVSFRVLDGDPQGRAADHDQFDHKSHSALYNIAHCSYSKEIITHPVVRLLTQRKWDSYGKRKLGTWIAIHLFYIICMTTGFFLKHANGNRAKYEDGRDKARAVFEMITFAMACCYAIIEIIEMFNERRDYLSASNAFDCIGIALVIALLPVKFLTVDHDGKNPSEVEWYVASVTYLVNVFRLFKWFPVIEYIGVHANLIKKLFIRDIPQFLIVYSVVAASFLGSVVLALRATEDGFSKADIESSWGPVLAEIRALTETNGFADSYIGKFRTGVIILLMLNMLCCILILANILIAHLSNVYTDASAFAHIQCDIDRTALITKYENSWFKSWSPRMNNYKDGLYVKDIKHVEKMMGEWNEQQEE